MLEKKWLIFANGLLWSAAGFNILRIGVKAAISCGSLIWLLFIPVFAAFGAMFFRMVGKNTKRINELPGEKAPLYKFLALKGYLIIVFMMTLGITLRNYTNLPDGFFAFFYTGLGGALTLAGILFIIHSFRQ